MKTINEICEKHNYVIVDACAFMSPLNEKEVKYGSENIKNYLLRNENLSLWIKSLNNYQQIISTEKVINEIDCNYKYTKSIKRSIRKEIVQLRRLKRDEKRGKMRIKDILKINQKTVKLNPEQREQYQEIFEEYLIPLNRNDLSGTDCDILVKGILLAKKDITCIISNDFGIVKSWANIVNKDISLKEKLNFYLNWGRNNFEELIPKNHNNSFKEKRIISV